MNSSKFQKGTLSLFETKIPVKRLLDFKKGGKKPTGLISFLFYEGMGHRARVTAVSCRGGMWLHIEVQGKEDKQQILITLIMLLLFFRYGYQAGTVGCGCCHPGQGHDLSGLRAGGVPHERHRKGSESAGQLIG